MQDQARRGSNGLSRSSSWIFNVWSVGRGFVSVQGERFEPGRGYADIIETFDVQFQPVDVSHYKEWVGWAIWFYDSDPASFPLLQCFYPDMNGKFPWEPDCESWAVKSQPLLYKPKGIDKAN